MHLYNFLPERNTTVGAKNLERAKSLERSSKKALISTKKALYVDFHIFPKKFSPFSILFSRKKMKKIFYQDGLLGVKKNFSIFGKVPFCQCHFF
jgi:hypothetical protein